MSALFHTTITVFFDFLRIFAISKSKSVTLSTSRTNTITSDFSIDSSALFLTSVRISLLEPAFNHQESAIMKLISFSVSLIWYSIISRVVFSVSDTIAILCQDSALKRLDLPTFGLHTIVILPSIFSFI